MAVSVSLMLRWKLFEMMGQRRITNRRLAQLTGLHEATISRLKNAETVDRIDSQTLVALCKALECTPNDLIHIEGNG